MGIKKTNSKQKKWAKDMNRQLTAKLNNDTKFNKRMK